MTDYRTVGASGSCDGDIALPRDGHQQFIDTVQHREMNRSADVIGAVQTLTELSFPKDPHKGPTGSGVSMK